MIFFLAARFEAALTFLHPGKKEASIYFACVILLIDSRAFPGASYFFFHGYRFP